MANAELATCRIVGHLAHRERSRRSIADPGAIYAQRLLVLDALRLVRVMLVEHDAAQGEELVSLWSLRRLRARRDASVDTRTPIRPLRLSANNRSTPWRWTPENRYVRHRVVSAAGLGTANGDAHRNRPQRSTAIGMLARLARRIAANREVAGVNVPVDCPCGYGLARADSPVYRTPRRRRSAPPTYRLQDWRAHALAESWEGCHPKKAEVASLRAADGWRDPPEM